MKYFIVALLLLVVSCSNSNLYELGMERTYYVDATTGKHIETTWGPRNIWAWPSIIIFYPVALIYDLGEIGVKKIVEWIRKKPP